MRVNDEFLEVAQIYGNLYGTPRNFVSTQLDAGRDVLFDIDSQGAYQLMENLPNRVLSIFIIPPSMDVLRERLINRNQDDPVTIEKRLKLAEIEMREAENYDYIVINDNFEKTVEGSSATVEYGDYIDHKDHICIPGLWTIKDDE